MGAKAHAPRWYIAYGFLALSCRRSTGAVWELEFSGWKSYVSRGFITHTLTSITEIWIVQNNDPATKAIIVCSYFFVCRYVDPNLCLSHTN